MMHAGKMIVSHGVMQNPAESTVDEDGDPDEVDATKLNPVGYRGSRNQAGQRHGFGVWIRRDGQKYEGQWKNGKRHGSGHMTYVDGSFYTGQYKDGFRDGAGTSQQPSHGQAYSGDWKKGRMHGQGTLQLAIPSGGTMMYTGGFENGMRHGHGKAVNADQGKTFEGEWVHDSRHGHGKLVVTQRVEETAAGVTIEVDKIIFAYDGEWRYGQRCARAALMLA